MISPMHVIHDDNVALLGKMMEMSFERQKVIGNNMANASTPGYLRRVYNFEDELAKIVKSNDQSRLFTQPVGEIVKDTVSPTRLDGNNVNMGNETNDMMQNGIYYNLLTKALKTKMGILRTAMEK